MTNTARMAEPDASGLSGPVARLVAGVPGSVPEILTAAGGDDVTVVLAAGVVTGNRRHIERAARLATTARDRQLVAVVTAYIGGDTDRLYVLVRDHLADHPDSLLASWVAGLGNPCTNESQGENA
jgi:hypothetical protein